MIDSELLRVFVLSPAELDPWDYHRSVWYQRWQQNGVWYVLSSTFTCLVGCCKGRSRAKVRFQSFSFQQAGTFEIDAVKDVNN